MADDEPFLDRIFTLQDVDIRPADRRERHLDERLSDARNRTRNHTERNLPFPLKYGRSHRCRMVLFSFGGYSLRTSRRHRRGLGMIRTGRLLLSTTACETEPNSDLRAPPLPCEAKTTASTTSRSAA